MAVSLPPGWAFVSPAEVNAVLSPASEASHGSSRTQDGVDVTSQEVSTKGLKSGIVVLTPQAVFFRSAGVNLRLRLEQVSHVEQNDSTPRPGIDISLCGLPQGYPRRTR